jgi:DNA-binding Xre family transcriptional regulator
MVLYYSGCIFATSILIFNYEVIKLISYEPLRITLKEKNMSYREMARISKLDDRTRDDLGQNKPVSLTLKKLSRICKALNVPIEKVVYIDYENDDDINSY